MRPIRLVTFDALHTIITPRKPIHSQYSQVFEPFVGALPPDKIKQSFKVALKEVQNETPSYKKGAESWWRDVIRRTALNSGADEQALDSNLSTIVEQLMKRFSSKEGYAAFEDASPSIHLLHELGVRSAIISNGDSRLRFVIKDLELPSSVNPIVLSEEEGIEKPSPKIFLKTLDLVNRTLDLTESPIRPEECLHVGDELKSDYEGALNAGLNAMLLRRLGVAGESAGTEDNEDLEGVQVINGLDEVVQLVKARM